MIYVVELFSTVAATMQLAIARNGMFSTYIIHIFEYSEETIFLMSEIRRENTEFHSSTIGGTYETLIVIIIIMNLCLHPKYGFHYSTR